MALVHSIVLYYGCPSFGDCAPCYGLAVWHVWKGACSGYCSITSLMSGGCSSFFEPRVASKCDKPGGCACKHTGYSKIASGVGIACIAHIRAIPIFCPLPVSLQVLLPRPWPSGIRPSHELGSQRTSPTAGCGTTMTRPSSQWRLTQSPSGVSPPPPLTLSQAPPGCQAPLLLPGSQGRLSRGYATSAPTGFISVS